MKTNLVADNLDLIDRPEAGQVIAQRLFGRVFRQVAEKDVSRSSSLVMSDQDVFRNRARFSPADFEFVVVQLEPSQHGVRVKGCCCVGLEERNECARSFGQDANRLDRTVTNETEEFINRGVGGQVSKVDGTTLLRFRKISTWS